MPTIVSKTGGPIVELGEWVASKNSPEYTALMDKYTGTMTQGKQVVDAKFDAMVSVYLEETNQSVIL